MRSWIGLVVGFGLLCSSVTHAQKTPVQPWPHSNRSLNGVESITQYTFRNPRHIKRFQDAPFVRSIHLYVNGVKPRTPAAIRAAFKKLVRQALFYKEQVRKKLFLGTYISGVTLRIQGVDWSFPASTITAYPPRWKNSPNPLYKKNYTASYGLRQKRGNSFAAIKGKILMPRVASKQVRDAFGRYKAWLPIKAIPWTYKGMLKARWYSRRRKVWFKRFGVDLTDRHVRRWFIERVAAQIRDIRGLVEEAKRDYENPVLRKSAPSNDRFYGVLRYNKAFNIRAITIDNVGNMYPTQWKPESRYINYPGWSTTAASWVYLATYMRELRRELHKQGVKMIHNMGGYMDMWMPFSRMVQWDRIKSKGKNRVWGLHRLLEFYKRDSRWRSITGFDSYHPKQYLPGALSDGFLLENFFSPASRTPKYQKHVHEMVSWLKDRLREKKLLFLYTSHWFEFPMLNTMAMILRNPGDAVFVGSLPQIYDHASFKFPSLFSTSGLRAVSSHIEILRYQPARPLGRKPKEYCGKHDIQPKPQEKASQHPGRGKRIRHSLPVISNDSVVVGRWFQWRPNPIQLKQGGRFVRNPKCARSWRWNRRTFCVRSQSNRSHFLYLDLGRSLSDQRRYLAKAKAKPRSMHRHCYVQHLFRTPNKPESFVPTKLRKYYNTSNSSQRNPLSISSVKLIPAGEVLPLGFLPASLRNRLFQTSYSNVFYLSQPWKNMSTQQFPQ